MKQGLWTEWKSLQQFNRLPPKQRALVFYAENENYYPNLEGIIHAFRECSRQPIVYVTSQADDPVFQLSTDDFQVFYFKKLLTFFMMAVDCRVLVLTLTDLHTMHLKRSRFPVHYVYVFHSLVSTHMMYRETAFDHYDSLLCVGQYQIDEIRKRERGHKLPEKELVRAGYHRLERIRDRFLKYSPPIGKETEILIAPSWGEHHLLERIGKDLVHRLLAEGFRVTVRPHPETVRRQPDLLNQIESSVPEGALFELERNVCSDDALLRADIMICDLSGVALEYALGTERPVLFFDTSVKVKNPNYKQLGLPPIELSLRERIGELHSPENLENIPEAIHGLLARKEEYRAELEALRTELIFTDANAAGADLLLSKLR